MASMRRIFFVLFAFSFAVALAGCPVFTRGEGPQRREPEVAAEPQAEEAEEGGEE
jgi:hypothetical protein